MKFSLEGAKFVTETESVDDIFNGSADSDGMLRLKGYSASIERVRQLFVWLMPLARDYYPDPIPRKKAIDEVELELLVTYDTATQVQRKTVATLLRALTFKGWIYVTGGRDFGVTDDGWIELGGEPQRIGDAPPVTTVIIQEEVVEPHEPEEVLAEPDLESSLQSIEEEIGGVETSLASYIHKVDKLLSVNAAIEELQVEKGEIEEWLKAHHAEINDIAKQLV